MLVLILLWGRRSTSCGCLPETRHRLIVSVRFCLVIRILIRVKGCSHLPKPSHVDSMARNLRTYVCEDALRREEGLSLLGMDPLDLYA